MNSLDNPAWAALNTFQAHLAVGGALARRYPEDLTAIAAVASREQLALDELATPSPTSNRWFARLSP